MILIDTRWNSGLYDYDGETLSKILMLHKEDRSTCYERFEYSFDNDNYRVATEDEITEFRNNKETKT